MRMPCTVVGHLEPLWCPDPRVAETFDYEGELAVVIGTPGRHIPVTAAAPCRGLCLLQRRLGARIPGP